MQPIVIRDSEIARRYLLQSLWFQRAAYPGAATAVRALRWALTITEAGTPLPPVGFVADLGHVALGRERDEKAFREALVIPGLPATLLSTYEDQVLGKLYADASFERASDALKRISAVRNRPGTTDPLSEQLSERATEERRALGLAYLVKQFRERGEINGVELSPAVVRGLLDGKEKPEDLLRTGWESFHQYGPLPILIELYEQLIAAARRLPEVLDHVDVLALEQQTALLSMSEYVAHRQILQAAARLEEGLPRHKLKPLSGRREVPTRVLDEDTYPVGGFTSISTRGSVESLLQSQLAFMEKDAKDRPDLFDIRFLRDELYYYSRDENQFLRRRRTFLFVLNHDLIQARFKDTALPWQRIVLTLATLVTTVNKLSDWLGEDALHFEFLFVPHENNHPLEDEAKLLGLVFREQIENQTVSITHVPLLDIEARIRDRARRSLCHCLALGTKPWEIHVEEASVSFLRIAGPLPELSIDNEKLGIFEGDEPLDGWIQALLNLLQFWIT